MRLEFIVIVGIFFNLMLAGIFPYQLLDTTTANYLVGDQVMGYDFAGSSMFSSDLKNEVTQYGQDARDDTKTGDLTSTTDSTFMNPAFDNSISYFNGIVDAMKKLKSILSLIIPFASLFFLLPGIMGLVIGGTYTGALIFAIIRFIRGA